MMPMTLIERIRSEKPLLLDGGMGTQLEAAGLAPGGLCNLSAPDVVRGVHRRYVEAGSEAVITNTLTMNRISSSAHGQQIDLRAVNLAGARIAREAVGAQRYVLGDLSATGQMLEPYGDYTEAHFEEAYEEQARALAEGGVDGFIVETVYDLREALCALRACLRVGGLPVLVSMTFQTANQGGRTMMGNTAADCARTLTTAGAHAVGTNCGEVTPDQMASIVREFRAASALPVMAQPNAGLPALIDGKALFSMAPAEFAIGAGACQLAGATILGGCCGTTPDHIRALAATLAAG